MSERAVVEDFVNSYDALNRCRAKTLDARRGRGPFSDLAARTVRDWGAEWLDRRESSGVRAIKDDRIRWRVHVLEFAPWANSALSSVTRLQARDWLATLSLRRSSNPGHKSSRKLAAQTLRNILNLVRRCFADALEDELIDVNPFAGLKVHRSRGASTRETSTVLVPDEREKGLAALARYPERWMVGFSLGAGLRQGEQWSLRLQDLILDGPRPRAVLRFGSEADEDGEDGPTKGGKVRTIRLFGLALESAREWVAQLSTYAPSNPLGLVFPTRKGGRRRHGQTFYGWKHLVAAVGRHVRWHDLRHSCATALLAGWFGPAWSIEALCRYLGHSSIGVTQKYARIVQELADVAVERMVPVPRPLRVPSLARRVMRARKRSVKSRGDNVDKTTDSDAAESGDLGAVAKWLGTGLQNRSGSEGLSETTTPEGVDSAPELADAVERTRARLASVGLKADSVLLASYRKLVPQLREKIEQETRRANENAKALFDAVKLVGKVTSERDALATRTLGDAPLTFAVGDRARVLRSVIPELVGRMVIVHEVSEGVASVALPGYPHASYARALVPVRDLDIFLQGGGDGRTTEAGDHGSDHARGRGEAASSGAGADVGGPGGIGGRDPLVAVEAREGAAQPGSIHRAPDREGARNDGDGPSRVDVVESPAFATGERARLVKKVACSAPVGSVGVIERIWPPQGLLPMQYHLDELKGPDGERYPGIVVGADNLEPESRSPKPLSSDDDGRIAALELRVAELTKLVRGTR